MDQTDRVLSLLDRKYSVVFRAPPEEVVLESCAFLTWLEANPDTRPYIIAIHQSQVEDFESLGSDELAIVASLTDVKRQMIACRPHLDDTQQVNAMRQPGPLAFVFQYDSSFARFDDLLNESEQVKLLPDFEKPYLDKTRVGGLLAVLNAKLHLDPTLENDAKFQAARLDFINIRNQHEYRFKAFANRRRLGASLAYFRLHRLRDFVNPNRPSFASCTDYFDFERNLGYAHEREAVRKTVYEETVDGEVNARAERDAGRLYEAVRQRIGTTNHHLALLNEYKVRCMHYDKTRLRELVDATTAGARRNIEDRLALELATWLYDHGLPVAIKSNIQNLQPDLLGQQQGFLVEAKAYASADRQELTQGIAQLHAYMNALEGAARAVQEAFYVVFRRSGNLVDLPRVIDTNRFRIHTLVIDLGDSANSGRRQPKPMVITTKQILEALTQR